MSEFNEQLFVRVCTLEGELQITKQMLYETQAKLTVIENLLQQALTIIRKGDRDGISEGNQES